MSSPTASERMKSIGNGRNVALGNQTEKAVDPAKALDDIVVVAEGPDYPWIECLISCSVCNVDDTGKHSPKMLIQGAWTAR
jgi:hypothetical protein